MVISQLHGGLGNQMFQYAVGLSLADKLDTDLFVDTMKFKTYKLREYELSVFKDKPNLIRSRNLANWSFYETMPIKLLPWQIRNWIKLRNNVVLFREKQHNFDPELFKIKGNVYLVGYFQTEKYFAGLEKKIRNSFEFEKRLVGRNEDYAKQINSSNSVSIHVRRGDYVSNPSAAKFHGVLGKEYYQKAINRIKKLVKQSQFFVFSDDLEWTRTNLNLPEDTVYVEGNSGKNGYIDMQLMSMCKHNIVANSSFSWWGAWLNENPDKKVIAPKDWVADVSVNDDDVVPSSWVRI